MCTYKYIEKRNEHRYIMFTTNSTNCFVLIYSFIVSAPHIINGHTTIETGHIQNKKKIENEKKNI